MKKRDLSIPNMLFPVGRCNKHRSYRGMGKPKSHCVQCWRMWLSEHEFRWYELSVDEVRTVMLVMGGHLK